MEANRAAVGSLAEAESLLRESLRGGVMGRVRDGEARDAAAGGEREAEAAGGLG